MRQTQCSEAVMWMAERFQLLSVTYNRAVAQVQHNQDSLVDEKYTKWPSAIRQTRWPRQEVQGPHNLGKIPFQQPAQDESEHAFRNLSGLLTYPNTHPAGNNSWMFTPSLVSFLLQLRLHTKYYLLLMHWHNNDRVWPSNKSTCEGGWRACLQMKWMWSHQGWK